jgi:hypothetical protein
VCLPALAWLRTSYEDIEVVERSDLIVVGHLDKGSIVYSPPEGESGINRFKATLVVTEVVKSEFKGKQIAIFIHHGLTPVVGGHLKTPNTEINLRGDDENYPEDKVTIMNTGSKGGVVVEDATKDHVWFLRYLTGALGRDAGGDELGVLDPEDVRPAALKDYFVAYLADDPEQALKALAEENAEIAPHAQRYFDHLAIERALKLDEPKARIAALVPYSAAQSTWKFRQEAVEGIIACGEMAGPYLLKLFDAPEHRAHRLAIIQTWRQMEYAGCVEALVRLLETNDEFWAKREPLELWWSSDADLTGEQKQRYEEIRAAALALQRIRDPRAEAALELTKRRWAGLKSSSASIDRICENALEELRKQRESAQD